MVVEVLADGVPEGIRELFSVGGVIEPAEEFGETFEAQGALVGDGG